MAFHRDIFWVGKQWAVTGAGIQAVDQKRRSAYDLDVAGLWDDDRLQRMHALDWLSAEDFDKAVALARARFPAPPRTPLSLVDSVLEMIQPPRAEPVKPAAQAAASPVVQPPPVMPAWPRLKAEGARAHFLPQWRVRR